MLATSTARAQGRNAGGGTPIAGIQRCLTQRDEIVARSVEPARALTSCSNVAQSVVTPDPSCDLDQIGSGPQRLYARMSEVCSADGHERSHPSLYWSDGAASLGSWGSRATWLAAGAGLTAGGFLRGFAGAATEAASNRSAVGFDGLPTAADVSAAERGVDRKVLPVAGEGEIGIAEDCVGNLAGWGRGDAGRTGGNEARAVRCDRGSPKRHVWNVRPADADANIDGPDSGMPSPTMDGHNATLKVRAVTTSINQAGIAEGAREVDVPSV